MYNKCEKIKYIWTFSDQIYFVCAFHSLLCAVQITFMNRKRNVNSGCKTSWLVQNKLDRSKVQNCFGHMRRQSTKPHCLYLILNTQETSHFYWNQFWDKTDDENICHWNYFQIPWALSELPANWPGLTSLFGWIGLAS